MRAPYFWTRVSSFDQCRGLTCPGVRFGVANVCLEDDNCGGVLIVGLFSLSDLPSDLPLVSFRSIV